MKINLLLQKGDNVKRIREEVWIVLLLSCLLNYMLSLSDAFRDSF